MRLGKEAFMAEPEDPKKDKTSFINKLKEDERLKKGTSFFWDKRLFFLSGALMFIGLILSVFYLQIGGLFIGLAVGICFFDEIYTYFMELRDRYSEHGMFKTLMAIALVIYFLIAVPVFILATAIGFGLIYLIRVTFKK